ncbi:MAG: signal peptidase I [Leptospirales bacterium]|nr:signal peptidase I [Leptospirales bacterium]
MQQAAAGGMAGNLIGLVIAVIYIVGLYKTFEKAGQPGWAAIIPLYNMIVLLKVAGKPMWWILLLLCTGPIGMILVGMAVAERFGKSSVFGIVALGLFGFVGYPMLGFSDATYTAPPAA